MKKRWFLVGMIFLLVPFLALACGVAQEQHDAVVTERDTAQAELQSVKTELQSIKAELQSVKSDLSSSQAKVSELNTSLEKTEGELTATKSEYGAFKSEAKRLWNSLDGNLGLNNYILGVLAALLKDDIDAIPSRASMVAGHLAKLKDDELQALWEEAYTGGEEWQLLYAQFERFMARNNAHITSKAKVIRDKLAE